MPNLIVKIVNPSIGEKYFNSKCKIIKLDSKDASIAYCESLNDSNVMIRIHESDLQTVLPAIGLPIVIVGGELKGNRARILKLEEKDFSCIIRITKGPLLNRIFDKIPYEYICKIV